MSRREAILFLSLFSRDEIPHISLHSKYTSAKHEAVSTKVQKSNRSIIYK